MSYIRSTQNSESLYVYDSGFSAEFSWIDSTGIKQFTGVNISVFEKLLNSYIENNHGIPDEEIKIGNLRLIEIDKAGKDLGKMKLTFIAEDISLIMWDATWEYIVSHQIHLNSFRFKYLWKAIKLFTYRKIHRL